MSFALLYFPYFLPLQIEPCKHLQPLKCQSQCYLLLLGWGIKAFINNYLFFLITCPDDWKGYASQLVRSRLAYGEELPSAPCKTWSRSKKNAFLVLRQRDGGATRYCNITQSTLTNIQHFPTSFQKIYIHWVLDCAPGQSILIDSSGMKTQHCWVAGSSSPGWLSWF